MLEFKTLKEQYKEKMANFILVSVEDLNLNEEKIIDESFFLLEDKLDEIKILRDEIKRLQIELANQKAMNDDSSNEYDEES